MMTLTWTPARAIRSNNELSRAIIAASESHRSIRLLTGLASEYAAFGFSKLVEFLKQATRETIDETSALYMRLDAHDLAHNLVWSPTFHPERMWITLVGTSPKTRQMTGLVVSPSRTMYHMRD